MWLCLRDRHRQLVFGLAAFQYVTVLSLIGLASSRSVWYAAYHSVLSIMCILLIVEEVLNAPMGLLAPTHSRAGVGYTLMLWVILTRLPLIESHETPS